MIPGKRHKIACVYYYTSCSLCRTDSPFLPRVLNQSCLHIRVFILNSAYEIVT